MKRNKCLLSVIIPTYNRQDLLAYTLDSLVKQDIESCMFEVIVADDGSTDETFGKCKAYESLLNLKYAYQPDKGYRPASARNMGIRIAEGEICLFIDSGIILKSNCIREHIAFHNNRANVALVGYILGYAQNAQEVAEMQEMIDPRRADDSINLLLDKKLFLDAREPLFEKYDDNISDLRVPWTLFWGGHLSVLTDDLMQIGLFDEEYNGNWGCEDNDLGFRLMLAKKEICLCRPAVVLHLPHPSEMGVKIKQGYANCMHFHRKYKTDETRIFLDYYLREVSGNGIVDFNELVTKSEKLENGNLVK